MGGLLIIQLFLAVVSDTFVGLENKRKEMEEAEEEAAKAASGHGAVEHGVEEEVRTRNAVKAGEGEKAASAHSQLKSFFKKDASCS